MYVEIPVWDNAANKCPDQRDTLQGTFAFNNINQITGVRYLFSSGFLGNAGGLNPANRIDLAGSNCKVGLQQKAYLGIKGDKTDQVRIEYTLKSNSQFDGEGCDCPYASDGSLHMDAHLFFEVSGLMPNQTATVKIFQRSLSEYFNESEAMLEDTAYVDSASLRIQGAQAYAPQSLRIGGNNKLEVKQDTSVSQISLVNGDTVHIHLEAVVASLIQPPPLSPQNWREDDSWSQFRGEIYINMDVTTRSMDSSASADCPDEAMLYSLDIGSDKTYSDTTSPNDNTMDPGDLYAATVPKRGGSKVLYLDDKDLLNLNQGPKPSGGNSAPLCRLGYQQVDSVKRDYFDLDAFDQIALDLSSLIPSNQALMNPIPYDSLAHCTYTSDNLQFSVEEDKGQIYAEANPFAGCDAPIGVLMDFVKGTSTALDEVYAAQTVTDSNGQSLMLTYTPWLEESQLGFNNLSPDGDSTLNDDVDALDFVDVEHNCTFHYFSVDHEANYNRYLSDTLRPGVIYQARKGLSPQAVVLPEVHLGMDTGTDINAFEWVWLPHPATLSLNLALLFSTDYEDFSTDGRQLGDTLNSAGHLLASFLDGSYFFFHDLPLAANIDALSASCHILADSGSVFGGDPVSTLYQAQVQLDRLEIYPNPVQDVLRLKAGDVMKIREVHWYNTKGQEVQRVALHTTGREWELNVPTEPGLYLMMVFTEDGYQSFKVVKE